MPVLEGHRAALQQPVAILYFGHDGIVYVQAGDARVSQAAQFAGVGLVVAVLVLPDVEFAVAGIPAVDDAVAVAVLAGQLGVALAEVAAEQFAAVVDASVAVAVYGEEAVLR